MVNRKKRLGKGIESISRQIEIHEQKRKKAREEGSIELEDYYDREIKGLKKSKEDKEKSLNKE